MLAAIREFMTNRSAVSLADIAGHIETEPEIARGMVAGWVRKGKMQPVALACGGCTECDTATIEFYEWVNDSPVSMAPALSCNVSA